MMKSSTRSKGQVYSVGNYLMTGRVLGKGHFARVEEATHRIIGKKVAIKIIDLTCIKEEYARRNLHREPRVMAKLRHPCIAALYETMMHGPRLYVVMEAAGGGDLCSHVLSARGARRGLPESRARTLAAQLVSAVRHMHARGVVHRDLKMENIMLDSTKQFIKIVDFGLSNVWMAGAALRTPCGSLEYAAPELFVDGRRYGPEVDLWSIGVIVYGMVTGGLPFAGGDSSEGRSRPQLRAAITKGFTRKQRAALAFVSNECRTFVQHLLEPDVQLRMKIEEAAKHRWVKRPGMRMKAHPLPPLDSKVNREMYRQISELMGQPVMDVVAQIKAEPFGATAGIYNIKTHLQQLQATPGVDLLWSSTATEVQPASPPEYHSTGFDVRPGTAPSTSDATKALVSATTHQKMVFANNGLASGSTHQKMVFATNGFLSGTTHQKMVFTTKVLASTTTHQKMVFANSKIRDGPRGLHEVDQGSKIPNNRTPHYSTSNSNAPRSLPIRAQTEPRDIRRTNTSHTSQITQTTAYRAGAYKKPYKIYDNGDCGFDPRLPCIDEHSSTDINLGVKKRAQCVRKVSLEEERRLHSGPNRIGDGKRTDFYRRAGDCLQSWRTGRPTLTPPKILLQNTAASFKRASLGNIVSPHSSTTSQCKSDRTAPMAWFSSRNTQSREPVLQRLRRTAPIK